VKPCLKYLKWLLKVVKEQRAGNGHILNQTTYGTLEAQKGRVPFRGLERALVGTWVLCWDC